MFKNNIKKVKTFPKKKKKCFLYDKRITLYICVHEKYRITKQNLPSYVYDDVLYMRTLKRGMWGGGFKG